MLTDKSGALNRLGYSRGKGDSQPQSGSRSSVDGVVRGGSRWFAVYRSSPLCRGRSVGQIPIRDDHRTTEAGCQHIGQKEFKTHIGPVTPESHVVRGFGDGRGGTVNRCAATCRQPNFATFGQNSSVFSRKLQNLKQFFSPKQFGCEIHAQETSSLRCQPATLQPHLDSIGQRPGPDGRQYPMPSCT